MTAPTDALHDAAHESGPHLDRENPWPGLYPYDETGKDFFKGRTDAASELLRLITREDLVLLYGISGLGKTSLVRAGLFPILPRHVLPIYLRLSWVRDSGVRGARVAADADDLRRQVFTEAQRTARRLGIDPPARPATNDMWEYFRRADDPFWAQGGLLMTPLLILDQFEELFTHGGSSESARRRLAPFLQDLGSLVTGRAPQWLEAASAAFGERDDRGDELGYTLQPGVCKVILCFREDYLASVKGLSPMVPLIDRTFLRLSPMTRDEAACAVFEAGAPLIDQTESEGAKKTAALIIEKVAGAPGRSPGPDTVDPALLSLFCRELNERRKSQAGALIDRALVNSGEAGQIIGDFYRATMAQVSPATRRFVEEQMVLTDTRSRWPSARVRALSSGVPEEDLTFLINKRILRPDDSGGIARLELTHDVLVDVVLEERARREEQERADTVRKKLEDEAEKSRETLARQQKAANQQKRRLIGLGIFGGAAALVIVVLMAAIVSISALERSQRAQTWTRAATSALEEDPQLATVFAVRAFDESGGFGASVPPAAEAALNRAVRESHLVALVKPDRPPLSVSLSPDSRYLALVTNTGAEVELRTGVAFSRRIDLGRRSDPAGVFSVKFTRDSQQLFIIYADTSIERVNLLGDRPAREPLAPPVAERRGVSQAAVSGDGARVMVRTARERDTRNSWLSLFDTESRTWQKEIPAPEGGTLAISANANAYAVATADGDVSVMAVGGGVNRHNRLAGVASVELSPDAKRVLGIRRDRLSPGIVLWMVQEGRSWTVGLPSSAAVLSAGFSPDGSTVVVRQEPGVLFAWHVEDWRPVFSGEVRAEGAVFSDDSRELLTWGRANGADVWNVESGRRIARFAGHRAAIIGASLPDGDPRSTPAVTIAGDSVYLWNRATIDTIGPTKDDVIAVASSGGDRVAAINRDRTARVVDLSWNAVDEIRLQADVTAVALSRDGQRVAVGTAIGDVLVKRVGDTSSASIERLQTVGPVTAIAFGVDNNHVVFATSDSGGVQSTIVMKDLSSNVEVLNRHVQGRVVFVAVDANGRRVAVGLDEPGYGVAANSGLGARVDPQKALQAVALGTDAAPATSGRVAAAVEALPSSVSRHDSGSTANLPAETTIPPPPTGDNTPPPPAQRPSPGALRKSDCASASAGVSRDFGVGVTTAGCAPMVRLWANLSGQQSVALARPVQLAAISPGGRHFAVATVDGSVLIFRSEKHSDPIVVETNGPPVAALAFVDGDTRLAAVRSDRSFAIYPFAVERIQDAAQTIARRRGEPDAGDCDKYVGDQLGCERTSQWRLVTRHLLPWLH